MVTDRCFAGQSRPTPPRFEGFGTKPKFRRVLDTRVDRRFPVSTMILLTAVGLVAWKVTGFIPTESSLAPVTWSREAMQAGEWHRLLFSMFAHGGLLHLGFNALALFSLKDLETRVGSIAHAVVFLAGGAVGGIAHTFTNVVPTVGASGGIFALLGVLVILAPRTKLAFFGIPVPASALMSVYLAVVFLVPGLQDLAPIAHFAHVGGLVAGMASGVAIEPKRARDHALPLLLVFASAVVLVGTLHNAQLDQVLDALKQGGVLRAIGHVWPALAALAGIAFGIRSVPEPHHDDPDPARAPGS
jgi:membrane associated rhomboid family serine protease